MATPIAISKHFSVAEFVPKAIYEKYGKNSKWFIREEMVELAEFTREWFDAPVTINNWFWGGKFSERGFRMPNSTTGGAYSQHKQGNAIDLNVKGMTANQTRKEIVAHYKDFMNAGLTTLEHQDYAPTWVHMDGRTTDLSVLLVVKPVSVAVESADEEDLNEYFKIVNGVLVPIDFYKK